MASATSPTTGCACYCTAASGGRLTGPQDCEAAPHASWRRARYGRAALAQELARVVAAPKGQRNHQLWESTRNLYNLVAIGALDPREVDHGLLDAAERCGLLGE